MFFHDQPSHFLIHSQPAGFLLLTRFLLTDSLSAFLVPWGIGPLCFPGFPEFPNPHSDSAVVVLRAPFPSPRLSAQVFPVPSLSSSCSAASHQILCCPTPKGFSCSPFGVSLFPLLPSGEWGPEGTLQEWGMLPVTSPRVLLPREGGVLALLLEREEFGAILEP